MTIGLLERKAEIIERVAQCVRDRIETERAEAPERFVRQFYAQVAPGDVIKDTPDNLLGAALGLWQLGQQRPPRTPVVRVYTPHLAEHGWHSAHTIVELVTDDMPFLLESVTAYLNDHDAEVHLVIHPIIEVERAADGSLTNIHDKLKGGEGTVRESYMHIQVSEQLEEQNAELQQGVERVLGDVRAAVEDFHEMHARCAEVADELSARGDDVAESVAFLRWLLDDHFTFIGFRRYAFSGDKAEVEPGSGLGVLQPELAGAFTGLLTGGRRPVEMQKAAPVRITKASRQSTVHRPVRLDTIGVQRVDAEGNVVGENLFIGLFTSLAYGQSPRDIPILRGKVAFVIQHTDFHPESYNFKTLAHILHTYPRDELFQMSAEELQEISLGVLNLQGRPQIAFFPRFDPFGRFVSCLVYVPRDRYDTALRLRIQEILTRAYDGTISGFYTNMSDAPHARLHFIVKTKDGKASNVERDVIEHELIQAGRSWTDQLRDALIEAHGENRGLQLLRRYGEAFSSSYRDSFSPSIAVKDIASVDQALSTQGFAQNLYRPVEARPYEVRYKVCAVGTAAPLSDVLPVLENMGLRVYREIPYRIRPAGEQRTVWLRDFELRARDERPIDLAQIREGFHDAVEHIWSGAMEDDGFNQLVLRGGLSAQQVTILRAYCKYLRQTGITFSQEYMEETLANHVDVARWLVRLFEVRFDPEHTGDRDVDALEVIEQMFGALEHVSNLDEDRILRAFLTVVDATLRTNLYQLDDHGDRKGYLSLKLNSRAIPGLPRPRPLCEIFVYSPRVEAVHLRGGRVARGGIRWSDRREDFRKEVLGLMKAQMVKNTVIVPVGSKGGFVVKQPPEDRDALKQEVVACYQTLMSGLLDITDNLDGSRVVPPESVVRRDGDDPYLVVAADKGTATFSDTANAVAGDYGFWLDDAFASGGSAGYDHKVMAITARGAWESVKRHFRETGKDIQSEEFTVIGVGDMSGDVFGNGMLLSPHIRLLAAFNHMHVFVDPDPQAGTSYAERRRMFDLPASTWDDYNRDLISEGGGVWPRTVKSIPVSPQMQALFGIESSSVPPNELINAILKSEAELLWFGGIGTYVKATSETHGAAGDRANDAIRIDATELKARVVGEGANLAMTQKARVEFDLHGGRLYTDFIDNSGGVDCSDHEVNIKILLGEIERAGDITRKQRNELLVAMTDEVAELVLRDNYLQSQTISVTHQLGAHLLDRQARFMRALEKAGRLDRKLEDLPDDEELSDRMGRGIGLTRPELCTLLSYAKMSLYEALLAADLPDDEYLIPDLMRYFPTPLQERYPEAIQKHRLRREIIATLLTNEMLNRAGVGFMHEVREKTGHPECDIARAYLISRSVFQLEDLYASIESLDNQVPAAAQAALLVECGRLLDRGTVWMLRHTSLPLDVQREADRFDAGVKEVYEHLDAMLGTDQVQTMKMRVDALQAEGAPVHLANRVARLYFMVPACAIVLLAGDTKLPVERVAATYFRVGSRFGFNWLRRTAQRLPSDTAWDKLAVTALVDDLEGHQLNLTRRIMATPNGDRTPDDAIDTWAATRRPLVSRAEQVITELQSQATLDFSMLAVASRQLNAMIG